MSEATTLDHFGKSQKFLTQKASRNLYILGILALISTVLWFIKERNWEVSPQTLWGIGIMALASYPALMWAKKSKNWLPIFEVAMLIFIPQYALPLLSHSRDLLSYPESTISKAALLIAYYIFIAIIGFSTPRKPLKLKRIFTIQLFTNKIYRSIHLGILASNIYSLLLMGYPSIFGELTRSISILFLGLSTIAIFITSQLWGLNLLNSSVKAFFLTNLLVYVLLAMKGVYLILGFSTVFLAIISYSSAKKKVPILVAALFLLLISILHLGKGEMRGKYWNFEARGIQSHRSVQIHELPSFYLEWFSYGLVAEKKNKEANIESHTSLDRASLFPIACLAVDRIRGERDYLMGSSYLGIPSVLIPRFIWHEKPSPLDSNNELMVHLGLVNPDQINVSITIGLPSEAYMNFGFMGVTIVGFLLGFLYKNISLIAQAAPQFSVVGILSILILASASQSDQNAAIWASALFQMASVCIGIPLLYNILFRPESLHKHKSVV